VLTITDKFEKKKSDEQLAEEREQLVSGTGLAFLHNPKRFLKPLKLKKKES
jgi:hypothetical protein